MVSMLILPSHVPQGIHEFVDEIRGAVARVLLSSCMVQHGSAWFSSMSQSSMSKFNHKCIVCHEMSPQFHPLGGHELLSCSMFLLFCHASVSGNAYTRHFDVSKEQQVRKSGRLIPDIRSKSVSCLVRFPLPLRSRGKSEDLETNGMGGVGGSGAERGDVRSATFYAGIGDGGGVPV
jgi:hypothetical protein